MSVSIHYLRKTVIFRSLELVPVSFWEAKHRTKRASFGIFENDDVMLNGVPGSVKYCFINIQILHQEFMVKVEKTICQELLLDFD